MGTIIIIISSFTVQNSDVPKVSKALRAEFARGDGRIKRKEDDRRKNIKPSETLFVVNFHEETTKREDLQMLFEPFGELVRIDMKITTPSCSTPLWKMPLVPEKR